MAQQSHSTYVAQDNFRALSSISIGSDRPVCQDCAFVQSSRQELSMTKQMTPLRQRMIEDMTIRNMSPSTQKIYVAAVANFSIFHGRAPDKLTFEDVRNYRLHLISRGLKPNSINPMHIPYARRADPLPAV